MIISQSDIDKCNEELCLTCHVENKMFNFILGRWPGVLPLQQPIGGDQIFKTSFEHRIRKKPCSPAIGNNRPDRELAALRAIDKSKATSGSSKRGRGF